MIQSDVFPVSFFGGVVLIVIAYNLYHRFVTRHNRRAAKIMFDKYDEISIFIQDKGWKCGSLPHSWDDTQLHDIIHTLDGPGFHWEGDCVAYWELLQKARDEGFTPIGTTKYTYPCDRRRDTTFLPRDYFANKRIKRKSED